MTFTLLSFGWASWIVVWCLTWTWEKFSVKYIFVSNIFSVLFCLFLLVFPVCIHHSFCSCSIVLGIYFLKNFFFYLLFSFRGAKKSLSSDSFLSCIQSNKSIIGIFHLFFFISSISLRISTCLHRPISLPYLNLALMLALSLQTFLPFNMSWHVFMDTMYWVKETTVCLI